MRVWIVVAVGFAVVTWTVFADGARSSEERRAVTAARFGALHVTVRANPVVDESAAAERGEVVVTRAGGCDAMPGVVLILKRRADGTTRKAFGRHSRWEWDDLASGDYELSVGPDFASVWSCDHGVINVYPSSTTEVAVALTASNRVAGRIVDGATNAVPQGLRLTLHTWRNGAYVAERRAPVMPSPDGAFCVEGWRLPSDDIDSARLIVSAPGYADTRTELLAVDNGATFQLDDLDIRMFGPTVVKGTVTSPAGKPMTRVLVRAAEARTGVVSEWDPDVSHSALTDAQGRYELVFAGSFDGTIEVENARFKTTHSSALMLEPGEQRTVDIVVKPLDDSIRGRLMVDGTPLGGYTVLVVASGRDTHWRWDEVTDEKGEFEAIGVAPGAHRIYVTDVSGPQSNVLGSLSNVLAIRNIDVVHGVSPYVEFDFDAGPPVSVYVNVSSSSEASMTGALYDPYNQAFVGRPARVVAGGVALWSPVRREVFVTVTGGGDGTIICALVPLDLTSGVSPANLLIDTTRSELHVSASEDESDDKLRVIAATGNADVDAFINGGGWLSPTPVTSSVTYHGLPDGNYTLRREGEHPGEVSVTVGASTVEVEAP